MCWLWQNLGTTHANQETTWILVYTVTECVSLWDDAAKLPSACVMHNIIWWAETHGTQTHQIQRMWIHHLMHHMQIGCMLLQAGHGTTAACWWASMWVHHCIYDYVHEWPSCVYLHQRMMCWLKRWSISMTRVPWVLPRPEAPWSLGMCLVRCSLWRCWMLRSLRRWAALNRPFLLLRRVVGGWLVCGHVRLVCGTQSTQDLMRNRAAGTTLIDISITAKTLISTTTTSVHMPNSMYRNFYNCQNSSYYIGTVLPILVVLKACTKFNQLPWTLLVSCSGYVYVSQIITQLYALAW